MRKSQTGQRNDALPTTASWFYGSAPAQTLTTGTASIRSKPMSLRIWQQPLTGWSARDAAVPEIRTPALSRGLGTIAAWIARSSARRALRDLAEDRRRLSAVGLSREQALREADKPFWRR